MQRDERCSNPRQCRCLSGKDEIYGRVAAGRASEGGQQRASGCPSIRWSSGWWCRDGFDAADDWIVERADARTVVITGDILLADRCLKKGATVIGPNGKPFTAASIGGAIATRAIMADLRAGADVIGGPAPFAKADRSRFLQALDEALVRLAQLPNDLRATGIWRATSSPA